jgi:hypothetical protein
MHRRVIQHVHRIEWKCFAVPILLSRAWKYVDRFMGLDLESSIIGAVAGAEKSSSQMRGLCGRRRMRRRMSITVSGRKFKVAGHSTSLTLNFEP